MLLKSAPMHLPLTFTTECTRHVIKCGYTWSREIRTLLISFSMPRKGVHKYSPSKRGRIIALRDDRYSYREIAAKINGASASGAQKTVKHDKICHIQNTLLRSGRPASVTSRTTRVVLWEIIKNRFDDFSVIATQLGTVSKQQVKHIAHQAGYHRHVTCQKPYLTAKIITKQKQWAVDNAKKDWDYVLWTDETRIETGARPGRRRVTRLPGQEFLPENIAPTFRSGWQSIMVWDAITHNRKGPIICLDLVPETTAESGQKSDGGLDGPRYVKQVLNGPLYKFWKEV